MTNTFRFNSRDWDSIEDTINKINEMDCMLFGKTENGEDIIFSISNYGEGDCLVTEVFQENVWVRKSIYHPDGTIEQVYHRE